MRVSQFLLLVLVAICASRGDARAQDAGPDDPAQPTTRPTPEPSLSWANWSRGFAAELLARNRPLEAVEEMHAAALFDVTEVDLLCDAAVILVDAGSQTAVGIAPGSSYQVFAATCVAMAIARGAGPEESPEESPEEAPVDVDPNAADETPELRKGDPRLAYALGRLAWARDDVAVAYRMFHEAYDGGFEPARMLDWYFTAAVEAAPEWYSAGLPDPMIADLERLLALAPDHPRQHAAKIQLADGHRVRRETVIAHEILEPILKERPQDGSAWSTLGLVLRDEGKTEEAADALQRSVDALARAGEDFTWPLLEHVEVLQKLARFEEAESEIQRYLVLRPDDPEGIYRLSRIRRDAGDLDEAVVLARKAVRLDRESLKALENLRTILHRRDGPDDAEELVDVTARYEERLAELEAERDGPEELPEPDGEQPHDTSTDPEVADD